MYEEIPSGTMWGVGSIQIYRIENNAKNCFRPKYIALEIMQGAVFALNIF